MIVAYKPGKGGEHYLVLDGLALTRVEDPALAYKGQHFALSFNRDYRRHHHVSEKSKAVPC
jgi:hypothetical protein